MGPKLILKYLQKLPGKWFLIIIAIVWTLGVGLSWYNITTCIIITAVVVAIWFIYLLIRWLIRRGRAEEEENAAELVPGFEERLVKATELAKNSPWYLVIGPESSGKTSLLGNLNLDFSYIDALQEKSIRHGIETTQNCDLFLTKEAIALDTAGRYLTYGNEAQVKREWFALLSLLSKHRRERPIEGLVIAIDADRLLQIHQDVMEKEATILRDHITEIVSRLGVTFPVYLVFTKCDLIYGFREFFDDLSRGERSQVWGATLKSDQQENPEAVFREGCKQLFDSLIARRKVKLASTKTQEKNEVYTFPVEFDEACQKLTYFVSVLLPSRSKERPLFRGFYFTSGTQGEGSPVDFVMQNVVSSFSPQPSSKASSGDALDANGFFIKDLFHKVVFPDRGLDKPTSSTERRKKTMRLVFCAVVIALFAILATMFTVSYFHNKGLMNDTGDQTARIAGTTSDTQPGEKLKRFEDLRKSIVQLERRRLFSLPWQGRRNDVADAARRLYLRERYGSDAGWETNLRRKIEIPVGVFKAEADILQPIEKANIKAVANGKTYKLKTNKEGATRLRMKVEDGRADVAFSTDHQEPGYELQDEQIYQIQPGELTSKKSIEFIFSKLGRVIAVHCVDQFGQDLTGVPVSIIEQVEESKEYGPETSNEQGIAQIKLEAPEGRVLALYYGNSPTNYQEGQPDMITIQAGQSRYAIEKQLRRKIEIFVTAFEGTNPKPGITISIEGKTLGVTEPDGRLKAHGDTVPTQRNVTAKPVPKQMKVEQTSSGYSIALEYAPAVITTTPPVKPEPEPEPPPLRALQFFSESQKPIPNMEVWVYLAEGERKSFDSLDEMAFESDGKQFRLARLDSTIDSKGNLEIPREAEKHQLLLYHPDYWPEKLEWRQTAQPIQMVDIKQERSLNDFDKARIDGAEYYFHSAQQDQNPDEAIKKYQKAIRLVPRPKHYLRLGWRHYYDKEQVTIALKEATTGLELKLLDDPEADEAPEAVELTVEQQLRELAKTLQLMQ